MIIKTIIGMILISHLILAMDYNDPQDQNDNSKAGALSKLTASYIAKEWRRIPLDHLDTLEKTDPYATKEVINVLVANHIKPHVMPLPLPSLKQHESNNES